MSARREGPLADHVPAGVTLADVGEAVGPDLVDDADLRDLLRDLHVDEVLRDRGNIPRVRPILVALAARASGAQAVDDEIQHAAELLHLALQFHDVALGREGGRRRRVVRRFVRSFGWLGGNHFTVRALELVRATRPDALADVVDTMREFAEGHALSQDLIGGRAPRREDWSEHADTHTGALFAFCCRAGGSVATASTEARTSLARYGRHLGRLWHVAEDLSALLHTDPAEHLRRRASAGRPLLPVVLAIESDPSVAPAWRSVVRDPSAPLGDLVRRATQPAVQSACRDVMLVESFSARRALHELPASRYRTAMEKLAISLVR